MHRERGVVERLCLYEEHRFWGKMSAVGAGQHGRLPARRVPLTARCHGGGNVLALSTSRMEWAGFLTPLPCGNELEMSLLGHDNDAGDAVHFGSMSVAVVRKPW